MIPVNAWRPIRQFLSEHWILCIAGFLLVFCCLDGDSGSPAVLRLGHLFSGPIYNGYIVVTLGLLLLIALYRRLPHFRWWCLDVCLSTFLLAQGLKAITRLPRPSGGPTGFPSGHTTFAFALAWLMMKAYPRLAPLWFGLAVAIGWSRVETGAHFPYQVLVGAVMGVLLGWRITCCSRGILVPRFAVKPRATGVEALEV